MVCICETTFEVNYRLLEMKASTGCEACVGNIGKISNTFLDCASSLLKTAKFLCLQFRVGLLSSTVMPIRNFLAILSEI